MVIGRPSQRRRKPTERRSKGQIGYFSFSDSLRRFSLGLAAPELVHFLSTESRRVDFKTAQSAATCLRLMSAPKLSTLADSLRIGTAFSYDKSLPSDWRRAQSISDGGVQRRHCASQDRVALQNGAGSCRVRHGAPSRNLRWVDCARSVGPIQSPHETRGLSVLAVDSTDPSSTWVWQWWVASLCFSWGSHYMLPSRRESNRSHSTPRRSRCCLRSWKRFAPWLKLAHADVAEKALET